MYSNIYLVNFEHKQTGKNFQKFGITKSINVMDRFIPERYKEREKYRDFNITLLYSKRVKTYYAEREEKYLINKYRDNFYLEAFLGVPRDTYKGMTGITELVDINDKIEKVINEMKSVL